MALMDRIDALPDDMKAICASFAYGYTEKGDEAWHALAFRVGADVYRYTLPYWYLAVFERCIRRARGRELLERWPDVLETFRSDLQV